VTHQLAIRGGAEVDMTEAAVWYQDTNAGLGEEGRCKRLLGNAIRQARKALGHGNLPDGAAAIGLLFAVSARGGYGISCLIGAVLAAFGNLSLLHSHGT
jgi:hypothetical protein